MQQPQLHLVAGIVFLIWGAFYLVTGRAFDRHGTALNRSNPVYWIIVVAILAVGVANIVWAL